MFYRHLVAALARHVEWPASPPRAHVDSLRTASCLLDCGEQSSRRGHPMAYRNSSCCGFCTPWSVTGSDPWSGPFPSVVRGAGRRFTTDLLPLSHGPSLEQRQPQTPSRPLGRGSPG